jgi:hypothetical protein
LIDDVIGFLINRDVNRLEFRSILFGLAVMSAACNNQAPSATPRNQTVAESAEQVMRYGRMILVANGARRGEALGNSIYTLDGATRFHFITLRVQFSTPLGRPLTLLEAPQGNYSLARPTLETFGRVRMKSDTSGRQLTGTNVRYDPVANQLASDSAFTATAGTRTLTGVGFTADPGLFSIKCLQRCSGSLGR